MRAVRTVILGATFAGMLALTGCGESDPSKSNGSSSSIDAPGKTDSKIQKVSEYKAEGLGTGYQGGSNAGNTPAK